MAPATTAFPSSEVPRGKSAPCGAVGVISYSDGSCAYPNCAAFGMVDPSGDGRCQYPVHNPEECLANGGTGFGCPTLAPPTSTVNLTGTALASYESSLSYRRSPQCVSCCGLCYLTFPSVDIFYFPVAGTNTNCHNGGASATATAPSASLPSKGIQRRVHSVFNNGSAITAVGDDGFIYTSPSIYVAFHNVYATDDCGLLGSYHTSLTLAFAPGELSTLVDPSGFGPGFGGGHPVMLDVADLQCPSSAALIGAGYDQSEHYKPILAAPSKLLNLDPSWHDCQVDRYQGVDPPRALTPAVALDPATSTKDPDMKPTPASPSSIPPALPKETDHAMTANAPSPLSQPSSINGDPFKAAFEPPQSFPVQPTQPTAAADPGQPTASAAPKPLSSDPHPGAVDPADPSANSRPSKAASALNNADPQTPQSQSAQSQDQQGPNQQSQNHGAFPTQSSSQTAAVIVQGQTVAENAPLVTIGGNPVAYSSGSLYVGSNVAPIQTTAQPQRQEQIPSPVVVGVYTFSLAELSAQAGNTGAAAVIVQGQTLSENAPGVTIDGNAVAYSAGSVYVGSNAAPAPTPAQQPEQGPSSVVVGGFTFSRMQLSSQAKVTNQAAVVVQGQTVAEGAAPVTIKGSAVVYSSGLIYVGSNAAPAPTSRQQQNQSPAVIGGLTYFIVPSARTGASVITASGQGESVHPSEFVFGSQTIIEGAAPVTISGIPVSLGSSGLVVSASTYQLPSKLTSPIVVVGGESVTAGSSGIEVDGTPLAPGASAITIFGTPVSLGPSGLVVGSSTILINIAPSTAPVLATIAGQKITTEPSGGVAIGGITLTPGGPGTTIAGTPVSLGASVLMVGTSSIPIPSPGSTAASIFTVAGQTFTANPTNFFIAGTTLSAGGPGVTISGTPVSLAPSGSLVIGMSTIPLTTGSSGSMGGVILSGLGPIGPTSTASGSSISAFTGAQPKVDIPRIAISLFGMAFCVALGAWILA